LSPYLIMDGLSLGVEREATWCMLFADDIAQCTTSQDDVRQNAENWRRALEDRGLKDFKVTGRGIKKMCQV